MRFWFCISIISSSNCALILSLFQQSFPVLFFLFLLQLWCLWCLLTASPGTTTYLPFILCHMVLPRGDQSDFDENHIHTYTDTHTQRGYTYQRMPYLLVLLDSSRTQEKFLHELYIFIATLSRYPSISAQHWHVITHGIISLWLQSCWQMRRDLRELLSVRN